MSVIDAGMPRVSDSRPLRRASVQVQAPHVHGIRVASLLQRPGPTMVKLFRIDIIYPKP